MKIHVEWSKTGEDDVANVIADNGDNIVVVQSAILNDGIEKAAFELERRANELTRTPEVVAKLDAIKVRFADEVEVASLRPIPTATISEATPVEAVII